MMVLVAGKKAREARKGALEDGSCMEKAASNV